MRLSSKETKLISTLKQIQTITHCKVSLNQAEFRFKNPFYAKNFADANKKAVLKTNIN